MVTEPLNKLHDEESMDICSGDYRFLTKPTAAGNYQFASLPHRHTSHRSFMWQNKRCTITLAQPGMNTIYWNSTSGLALGRVNIMPPSQVTWKHMCILSCVPLHTTIHMHSLYITAAFSAELLCLWSATVLPTKYTFAVNIALPSRQLLSSKKQRVLAKENSPPFGQSLALKTE